jgi:prevent-host-death family protein
MPLRISIKELHRATGEHVRRAGVSRQPVVVTDRGQPVAVLASLSVLGRRRRKRAILPEYKALLQKTFPGDTLEDLNAVRGDR